MSDYVWRRVYCPRVGIGVTLEEGAKCPECNRKDHAEVELPGSCGAFVGCPQSVATVDGPDHGHGCYLPPDHAGPHEAATCDAIAAALSPTPTNDPYNCVHAVPAPGTSGVRRCMDCDALVKT